MATTPISLKEAINQATQDPTTHTQQEAVETPVEKTEEVIEEKVEKVEKTEEPTSKVLDVPETEEQVQQALNIFRTLNNPQTATALIADLAKTAGIQIADTKITPKQATQTVIDVLKESLGEENEDLALKLAPALEKLIAEAKKPAEEFRLTQEAQAVKAEVDNCFDKLSKELPDFDKLQDKMNEISVNMKPGPKTTVDEYLRNLYVLAGGKPAEKSSNSSSTKTSVKTVVNKMVANAKETKTNVSGDVDEARVVNKSHRPSIREAVLSAAKTLNEKG